MIDMRKYSSGETYLTIADVREGPLQMTIADAKEGQYEKPNLHFETGDILSLNATNRKILMRAYGPTSDTWIGKQVELVLGQTMFQGAPQELGHCQSGLAAADRGRESGRGRRCADTGTRRRWRHGRQYSLQP